MEAQARSAKAQELMAHHAIDEAMAGAAAGVRDAPGRPAPAVDDPYARAGQGLVITTRRPEQVAHEILELVPEGGGRRRERRRGVGPGS